MDEAAPPHEPTRNMSAVDGAQAQFAVDALVWAPHPTEYVVAARVVDEPLVPGEPGTVRIVPDDGSPGLGATLHLTAAGILVRGPGLEPRDKHMVDVVRRRLGAIRCVVLRPNSSKLP